MQKKLIFAAIALCSCCIVRGQINTDDHSEQPNTMDESAFTLTEAQLNENDHTITWIDKFLAHRNPPFSSV